MTRLTARFMVDLLRRQVAAAGGFVTIMARGDDQAGAILIETADRGKAGWLFEPAPSLDGARPWTPTGPGPDADPITRRDYLARRRKQDPDLWIVELDSPDAERLVALWSTLD